MYIIKPDETLIFIIILGLILFLIMKTDYNILNNRNVEGEDIEDKILNIFSTFWPSTIGIFGILIFGWLFSAKENPGSLPFFVVIFLAIFFSSYTLYQWAMGGGSRTSECKSKEGGSADSECPEYDKKTCIENPGTCEWKNRDDDEVKKCALFSVPQSDIFPTKEYKIYRIIYYATILIVSFCAGSIFTGEYITYAIVFSPIIVPVLNEAITMFMNFDNEDKLKGITGGAGDEVPEQEEGDPPQTIISSELFLIHFMRGKHTGGSGDNPHYANYNAMNWLDDENDPDTPEDEGQNPNDKSFINPHFLLTLIFYIILMILLIIHSQGLLGKNVSETPIILCYVFLIFFPLIMKYIFVQECSYNEKLDELPDTITAATEEDIGEKVSITDESISVHRQVKRLRWSCIFEKYGGIQTMLCVALINLIICKTESKSYKNIAFVVMILCIYGLSQSFMIVDAYN